MQITGPESISPFVPFGNHYFLPPGIDTARDVVSCQPILQVSSGSFHCLPTHLSFRPYRFLGLKVLAVSSALCSSFSSYLQKPIFSCQKEESVACTSTSSWFCCSAEVQTVLRSLGIGMSINTVARMTQHPKGQDRRDFIFTPILAHG